MSPIAEQIETSGPASRKTIAVAPNADASRAGAPRARVIGSIDSQEDA